MVGGAIFGLSRALLGDVPDQQDARHGPGLGHVPDPALQGRAEDDERRRPAGRTSCRSAPASRRSARSRRRSRTRSSTRRACASAQAPMTPARVRDDAEGGRRRLGAEQTRRRALRGPRRVAPGGGGHAHVRVRFVRRPGRGCCSSRAPFGVQRSVAASIVLKLNADNTLELRLDKRRAHPHLQPAGTVIAPGTYAGGRHLRGAATPTTTYHMFHLSGPGVNLQTDLLGRRRARPSRTRSRCSRTRPTPSATSATRRSARSSSAPRRAGTAVAAGSSASSGSGGSSGGGTTSNTPRHRRTSDNVGSKVLRNAGLARRAA